ncbi:MAG: tetratricopeptide repeat protein [Treponema sp.]|jgi:tetratricopeptide (TPR) repeat protein|nr:tetratricopeptide repeat protein [Treponema sp.]
MKNSLYLKAAFAIISFIMLTVLSSCASRGDVQAEEYFSLGMAYFELGNYSEAEKWLNRARTADKTMIASEYNLGRIAFETGRFAEAAGYFERILTRDPENVMALKAAAYSRIKNGDLEKAEALYNRVLALVPESSDDGFNYALVLYSIHKYEKCEEVLNIYPFALEENPFSMLLLARAQKAQNKIEAVDTYAKWAAMTDNAGVRELYEYAQVLETADFYARSLEQYDKALNIDDIGDLKRSGLRFEKARILLFADPENVEGLKELIVSVNEGFSDIEAMEALLKNERIKKENRDEIRKIIDGLISVPK